MEIREIIIILFPGDDTFQWIRSAFSGLKCGDAKMGWKILELMDAG
jgi:hypothetical protein